MPDTTLTNIAIISRALIKIGGTPIQSLTDASREAQVASTLYQSILDSETAGYPWEFASTTIELNQLTAAPVDPLWQFQYQLPAGYLEIRDCMDESGFNCGYKVIGGVVLADVTRLFCLYTAKQIEGALPEYFVDALVARLAWEFTKSITAFEGDQDRSQKEYELKQRVARNRDASNNEPEQLIGPETSELVRAHYGSRWHY